MSTGVLQAILGVLDFAVLATGVLALVLALALYLACREEAP